MSPEAKSRVGSRLDKPKPPLSGDQAKVKGIRSSDLLTESLAEKALGFLGKQGARIAEITHRCRLADWNFIVDSSPENATIMDESEVEEAKAYRSPNDHSLLSEIMAQEGYENLDPIIRRQLYQLNREYEFSVPRPDDSPEFSPLMEAVGRRTTELEGQITAYKGEENDIGSHTAEGEDKTYAESLRDLVKERNRLAQMRGFGNYYQFILDVDDLTEEHVTGALEQLADPLRDFSSRARILKAKEDIMFYYNAGLIDNGTLTDLVKKSESDIREYIAGLDRYKKIAAWEGEDKRADDDSIDAKLKTRDPFVLLRITARLMGTSDKDIDDLLEKGDFHPREGKSGHWYCSPVDPPQDVRPFTNIPEDPAMITHDEFELQLLHEVLGHGLDFKAISPSLPRLLKEQDRLTTEGFATMFEKFIYDEEWLVKVLGVDRDADKAVVGDAKRVQLDNALSDLKRYVQKTTFELEMYEDPDQDLDLLESKIRSRVQDYDADPDPGYWASFTHYTTHPAYFHNYLFGEMWAAQVRVYAKEHFGGLLTPEAGAWLREHRSTGLLYTMDEQLVRMTGQPLSPDAYLGEIDKLIDELETDFEERLEASLSEKQN